MKTEITTAVKDCVGVDQLSDILGQKVVVPQDNAGEPKISVEYASNGVLVTLQYTVTLEGSANSTTSTFERRYDVRYLQIAQFAMELARKETQDILFNADEEDDYEALSSYKTGFTVTRKKVAVTAPSGFSEVAYLLSILDTKSKINGRPYTFSFLIENRRPMLDPITQAKEDVIRVPLSCNYKSNQPPNTDCSFPAADPDGTRVDIVMKPILGAVGITFCKTKITVSDIDDDSLTDWQTLDERTAPADLPTGFVCGGDFDR